MIWHPLGAFVVTYTHVNILTQKHQNKNYSGHLYFPALYINNYFWFKKKTGKLKLIGLTIADLSVQTCFFFKLKTMIISFLWFQKLSSKFILSLCPHLKNFFLKKKEKSNISALEISSGNSQITGISYQNKWWRMVVIAYQQCTYRVEAVRDSGPGSDQRLFSALKKPLLGDGDKGNSPWLHKMLRIKDSWGINLR